MYTIKIKDFALRGEFGFVKIGMKMDEVLNLLGETEIINDYETGTIGVNYGYYEFFFDKKTNLLKGIQNDHLKADSDDHKMMIEFKNNKIVLDFWFLQSNKNLTRKEVKTILHNEEIIYSEEIYWENKIIRFESGVFLDFDDLDYNIDSYEENQLLNGIRFLPNY